MVGVIFLLTLMPHLCPQCGRKYEDEVARCEVCRLRLVRLSAAIPAVDPLVGRSIDDRYLITDRIGLGGMGTVYKAYQASIDRHVAVKVLNPEFSADEVAIQRFFREAQATSRLSHPNIIQVFDFGQSSEGLLYIMMEYLEGRPLDQYMEQGPIPPDVTEDVLVQVCDALDAAHGKGIIHRDLKPENVFLLDHPGAGQIVKVLDFGIARILSSGTGRFFERTTIAGQVVGTPLYMSPERARGDAYDHRADLYSLGVMLFEMLTGKTIFDSESPLQLLLQQISVDLPSLKASSELYAITEEVEGVYQALVDKDPDRRPESARQARAMLVDAFKTLGGAGLLPRERSVGPARDGARPGPPRPGEPAPTVPARRLARGEEALAKLTEMVCLELRSPLTAVSSGVQLVGGSPAVAPRERGQLLQMVRRNVERMDRLITNTLTLVRLDSGSHTVSCRPTRLEAALVPLVNVLNRHGKLAGIAVSVEGLDGGLPAVVADPGALSLVLRNLVGCTAGLPGPPRAVRVSFSAPDQRAVNISVTDDGQGIPEELQARMKAWPGRDGSGLETGFTDTCIRLAVSRELLARMGCSLSVSAAPRGGTAFRFALPSVLASRELLFGQIALGLEVVEPGALARAVSWQMELADPAPRLGELLQELQGMTAEGVMRVLQAQERRLGLPHPRLPSIQAKSVFGRMALSYEFVDEIQLNKSVRAQALARDRGANPRLGEVLVRDQYMTRREVLHVLRMQQVSVGMCEACRESYNVPGQGTQAALCPVCGASLDFSRDRDEIVVSGDLMQP